MRVLLATRWPVGLWSVGRGAVIGIIGARALSTGFPPGHCFQLMFKNISHEGEPMVKIETKLGAPCTARCDEIDVARPRRTTFDH